MEKEIKIPRDLIASAYDPLSEIVKLLRAEGVNVNIKRVNPFNVGPLQADEVHIGKGSKVQRMDDFQSNNILFKVTIADKAETKGE